MAGKLWNFIFLRKRDKQNLEILMDRSSLSMVFFQVEAEKQDGDQVPGKKEEDENERNDLMQFWKQERGAGKDHE